MSGLYLPPDNLPKTSSSAFILPHAGGGQEELFENDAFSGVIENDDTAAEDAHADVTGERFVDGGAIEEKIPLRILELFCAELENRNPDVDRFHTAANAEFLALLSFQLFHQ